MMMMITIIEPYFETDWFRLATVLYGVEDSHTQDSLHEIKST